MNLNEELDKAEQKLGMTAKNNGEISFEKAKNKALENFKPTYDATKTMYENGKDLARTLGLNEALKDNKFVDKMKKSSQDELTSDMNADLKESQIKEQKKFYDKHYPVLKFARLNEPCGLALMKWIYAFTVVPFMISLIVGGLINLINSGFQALNSLFNSIMGLPEYYKNENTGELILDENKKPIVKSIKINLLTKILFWLAFAFLAITITFGLINHFTGFDIIASIRNLIHH